MKTARNTIIDTIKSYNSTVNDLSKFRFNEREINLFSEMLEEYKNQSQWIPVSEGLPDLTEMCVYNKASVDVLALTSGGAPIIAFLECISPDFKKQMWVNSETDEIVGKHDNAKITHWMSLPFNPINQ